MSRFGSSPQKTETSHSPSISTTSNSTSPSGGDGGGGGGGGGGDVVLKWGHRKRSRASRAATEDSSSSGHSKHRRISHTVPAPQGSKFSSASMPPPPPLASSAAASNGRGRKDSPRNLEDGSAAGSESPSRSSQKDARSAAPKLCPSSGVERSTRRMPCSGSAKCQKPSGSSTTTQASERVNGHGDSAAASVKSEQEGGAPHAPAPAAAAASLTVNGDKVTVQVFECPRICIALSRKEKEDDFLAMKGTKIPQRPKKRAKNVDRALQYCFPGMWLSDLTRSRYEVREKKSVKKQKRRGLKGMESLESESE